MIFRFHGEGQGRSSPSGISSPRKFNREILALVMGEPGGDPLPALGPLVTKAPGCDEENVAASDTGWLLATP